MPSNSRAGSPPQRSLTLPALRLPRARVEGVAGFYSFLYPRPAGRFRVLFSDNITDRMLGNAELMDALCRKLWIEPGKLSEDGLVSIDATSCTGLCDQGPAMLVNGRAIGQLNHRRINEIAELIRGRNAPWRSGRRSISISTTTSGVGTRSSTWT